MGNRGCLHDAQGRIRRQYIGRRWIICLLEFKGRHRAVMSPGHYTELFFLDEASALAAGHRPCAECQRARFDLFRESWAQANPALAGTTRPSAVSLDAQLHHERLGPVVDADRTCRSLETLPGGTFITPDERLAYLVLDGELLLWAPGGYTPQDVREFRFRARVLTPLSVVRTLSAGYPVDIHPSAVQ